MPFTVDDSELRQKLGALRVFLGAGANQVAERAARSSLARIVSGTYWTNRTHDTGRSFGVTKIADGYWRVQSGDKNAKRLDTGTRAHFIEPKKASGTLRFVSAGEVRFAKRVRHPGTRALKYTTWEQHAAEPEMLAAAERVAENAVNRAGLA